MKKMTVVLAMILGIAAVGSADITWDRYSPAFSEGDIALQAGVGLLYGMPGDVVIPPIGLSVDYALPIADLPFSIGAYLGYARSKDSYTMFTYDWDWTYTHMIFGGRIAYHVDFDVEKLDTYAGLILGYAYAKVEEKGSAFPGETKADAGGIFVGGYAGARYMFKPAIGMFGEVGYGVGILNLGVVFKV